jgi:hypothetical protein
VCEASTDNWSVQALQRLPVAPGDSQCIHLRGQGGGRVCIVQVVLGSQLINNNQVGWPRRILELRITTDACILVSAADAASNGQLAQ